MKNKFLLFTSIVLIGCFQCASGQNNRLNEFNKIGWYNYFGTFKISEKAGIHTEYQWRRNDIITKWQQSLIRIGINYNLNSRVQFRAGYGLIETFPYGNISINSLGRNFIEHRIFEMLQLTNKEGKFEFINRFMLEQRFIGRYSNINEARENEYPLLHRIRYMARIQVPIIGNDIKDKTPYIALYDEIFIGFGNNVNANIFDQNRIGLVLGYRFNKNLRIEAGYLNQILQLGREVNSQNVFQNNNGIIVNTNFNFDLKR